LQAFTGGVSRRNDDAMTAHLPGRTILLLILLSALWGGNMVAVKWSIEGVAPVFTAGLRSAVAALCVYAWMRYRGLTAFSSKAQFWHGLAVGVLFGAEFGCIYLGLLFTDASRTAILLYTHPFFVAVGAHLFLGSDRLHLRKTTGLLLAFGGILVLFARGGDVLTFQTLRGDLLILLAAALWAATTLYIKRFLPGLATPLQTLFYQLLFSIPLLFLWSGLLETRIWYGFSWKIGLSLFYQCVIVAFLSYLAWFELIHRYSVSLLAAFTFFTPVFGVFLSAAFLPNEALRPTLLFALALVCAGMVLVNRPERQAASKRSRSGIEP
jgi:drug/metabolite transporter (DMT)-like permease